MGEPAAEQIGAADFLVGLVPPSQDGSVMAEAIARIVESVPTSQAVLLHPPYTAENTAPLSANGHWKLIADPRLVRDPTALAQGIGDSFRTVFDATLKSGARGCVVI